MSGFKRDENGSKENQPRKQRFNWRKWRSLSVLGLCSCVMILKFQNCTPSNEAEFSNDNAQVMVEEPKQVGVINEVKSGSAVSFQSKSVEIHTEVETVALQGICPQGQEGAVLGWKIKESGSEGRALGDGLAKCEDGHFVVEVAPTQELECGQTYEVTARLGFGAEGNVMVARRCAPEKVANADDMLGDAGQQLKLNAASSCQVELQPGHGTGCSVVCYDNAGVVETEKLLESAACGL